MADIFVQNIMRNSFKYNTNGYVYIDDDILNYRGVGIYAPKLYFNFADCTIRGSHLYSTVYGGGGSNKYTIFATECRMALYENCGNSQYNILGHTYYANSSDTENLSLTDYVAYIIGENNIINITFYDTQHCKESIIYFDAQSMKNRYNVSTYKNTRTRTGKEINTYSSSNVMDGIIDVIDLGRANSVIPNYSDIPFSISNVNTLLSGLTTPKELDGFYNNVLSGVGIWGNISSNITWTNNGISLEDICRYPKDIDSFSIMPSIISTVSPSEDNPIEITIDFHEHPIRTQDNIWIEFDNRYVGSNVNIYFDHNNDENFTDVTPITIKQNYDKVAYYFDYQSQPIKLYRIKIKFTTALYIENLKYMDFSYNKLEKEYNPDNYIGIVNIGMSSPGLSKSIFLNNTGGELYGDLNSYHSAWFKNGIKVGGNQASEGSSVELKSNKTTSINPDTDITETTKYPNVSAIVELYTKLTGELNKKLNSDNAVGTKVTNGGELFNMATTATGMYSHAENNGEATGFCAHAENTGRAEGNHSHAEGQGTVAKGDMSHAQGYFTEARGNLENPQHVEGRWNIPDAENKYIHIAGNGHPSESTGYENSSNAHTLDWNGNAWFAGNVSIGTNNKLLETETNIQALAPIDNVITYTLSSTNHNTESRISSALETVTITISLSTDGYPNNYISSLVFTTTANSNITMAYTGSGALQWVGTDCDVQDGYSVFAPQSSKTYDIVFYFNGTKFIGLVNGYENVSANTGA